MTWAGDHPMTTPLEMTEVRGQVTSHDAKNRTHKNLIISC